MREARHGRALRFDSRQSHAPHPDDETLAGHRREKDAITRGHRRKDSVYHEAARARREPEAAKSQSTPPAAALRRSRDGWSGNCAGSFARHHPSSPWAFSPSPRSQTKRKIGPWAYRSSATTTCGEEKMAERKNLGTASIPYTGPDRLPRRHESSEIPTCLAVENLRHHGARPRAVAFRGVLKNGGPPPPPVEFFRITSHLLF